MRWPLRGDCGRRWRSQLRPPAPVNCSARFGSLRSSPTMDFSVSVRRRRRSFTGGRWGTLTPGAAASGGGDWWVRFGTTSCCTQCVIIRLMRWTEVDLFTASERRYDERPQHSHAGDDRSPSSDQRSRVDVVASTRRASSGRTEDGRRRRRMEYVTAARVTTGITAGMARVLRSVCTLLSHVIIPT